MKNTPSLLSLVALIVGVGCADDPIYVSPGLVIEVGADGETFAASASTVLPIRLERDEERVARDGRAAELGIVVPYVLRDDLDLEIEWSLRNLDDAPVTARIQLNGASELFAYRPMAFVVDPEEEEAPPPLVGDVPYPLDPLASHGGVFREDQLAEAALDLELIGRGALSPFTALLEVDEDRAEFAGDGGAPVPAAAWASLIRFDITVVADGHVVFEYAIRARDHREPRFLHPLLLDAPAGELTGFAPVEIQPPAEEP